MAYQRLQISPNAAPHVGEYIAKHWIEGWFHEAHWLLSQQTEPKPGVCAFKYVAAVFCSNWCFGTREK
jgi:hypothetical protein